MVFFRTFARITALVPRNLFFRCSVQSWHHLAPSLVINVILITDFQRWILLCVGCVVGETMTRN